MTLAELQTMRVNVLAALNGQLASGIIAYGINGRNIQKMNPADLWKMLSEIDIQIARYDNGMFYAAQFRTPE